MEWSGDSVEGSWVEMGGIMCFRCGRRGVCCEWGIGWDGMGLEFGKRWCLRGKMICYAKRSVWILCLWGRECRWVEGSGRGKW